MKNVLYPEWVLVLWAARRLGRPVKWIGDRSEDFVASAHGRDSLVRARLALDRDGRFLALEADVLANMGAYVSTVAPVVPTMAMGSAMGGVYDIPLIAFQTTRRLHQHDAGRRLSRRRQARGELSDRALHRHRRQPSSGWMR